MVDMREYAVPPPQDWYEDVQRVLRLPTGQDCIWKLFEKDRDARKPRLPPIGFPRECASTRRAAVVQKKQGATFVKSRRLKTIFSHTHFRDRAQKRSWWLSSTRWACPVRALTN